MHLYAYGFQDPINLVDFSGQYSLAAAGPAVSLFLVLVAIELARNPEARDLLVDALDRLIDDVMRGPVPTTIPPYPIQDGPTSCPVLTESNEPPGYPGDDPAKAPEGWEWKGKPGSEPGSKEGNYVRPGGGKEYLHPDLDHPPPIGPHWDYRDPDGNEGRIFPDGRWEPK